MAWFFVMLSLFLWTVSSDLLEQIAEQKEILFGLYSRQRFGQIFILNVLFLSVAYLCFSTMKFDRVMAYKVIAISTSTFLTIFAVILGSQWLLSPRYVEESVSQTKDGVELHGMVRHRPPNEFYKFTFEDKPSTSRSYPSAPRGHEPVEIELTMDRYGYRNKEVQENYDIVVVGDSFAVGSHVSDEQAWSVLLSARLRQSVYNLGVSGADPQVYLNNFVQLGMKFRPTIVLLVVYEGNDFRSSEAKDVSKESGLGEKISRMTKSSPVTAGLRRLSSEVFETINADAPVEGYQALFGWMPVRVGPGKDADFYSFKPKRLWYLYGDESVFGQSEEWKFTAGVLLKMKQVAEKEGFRLVIVYAPSKPHVVLPEIEPDITPEQMRSFVAYASKSLPPAAEFKKRMFDSLDSQENVLREYCVEHDIEFVSTTQLLQRESRAGNQTYYTYDQHWTPHGNKLVARVVGDYLNAAEAEPVSK